MRARSSGARFTQNGIPRGREFERRVFSLPCPIKCSYQHERSEHVHMLRSTLTNLLLHEQQWVPGSATFTNLLPLIAGLRTLKNFGEC